MNKKMYKKLWLQVLLTLSLLIVALKAYEEFSYRDRMHPVVEDILADYNKYGAKIRADLWQLQESPLFSDSSSQKDFSEIVFKHIGKDDDGVPPATKELQAIFKKHKDYRVNPESLQSLVKDPRLVGIDTRWVEESLKYDHWNWLKNPEVVERVGDLQNVSSTKKLLAFTELPLPDNKIVLWAEAYLLQKVLENQPQKGLQVYNHVAFLNHSTHMLVGSMLAVSMLKKEIFFRKNLNYAGTGVSSEKSIEAYERLAWAWNFITGYSLFFEPPSELKDFYKAEFGFCSPIFEFTNNYTFYYDFFGPQFWPERSFAKKIEFNQSLFKDIYRSCKRPELVEILKPELGKFTDNTVSDLALQTPFLRRTIGYVLMSVARPDFLKFYREQEG